MIRFVLRDAHASRLTCRAGRMILEWPADFNARL
jgi:hypothetical protein